MLAACYGLLQQLSRGQCHAGRAGRDAGRKLSPVPEQHTNGHATGTDEQANAEASGALALVDDAAAEDDDGASMVFHSQLLRRSACSAPYWLSELHHRGRFTRLEGISLHSCVFLAFVTQYRDLSFCQAQHNLTLARQLTPHAAGRPMASVLDAAPAQP